MHLTQILFKLNIYKRISGNYFGNNWLNSIASMGRVSKVVVMHTKRQIPTSFWSLCVTFPCVDKAYERDHLFNCTNYIE